MKVVPESTIECEKSDGEPVHGEAL